MGDEGLVNTARGRHLPSQPPAKRLAAHIPPWEVESMMQRSRHPRPQRWRRPPGRKPLGRRPPGASFHIRAGVHRAGHRRGACLFAAAALCGLLIYATSALRPTLCTMSAHEANIACTKAISEAVCARLSDFGTQAKGIVSLQRDATGAVTAAETDAALADRLKAGITEEILNAFAADALQQTRIPLGTLTGNLWLNGRGPKVALRIVPSRMVEVNLQSRFTDAGINQTLHQLLLTVEADAEAILPGLSSRTHISSSFLLAETVIVGSVPQAYTAITEASRELSGNIADYGAGLPPQQADSSPGKGAEAKAAG